MVKKKRRRSNRRKRESLGVRARAFALRTLKITLVIALLPTLAFTGWKFWGWLTTTEYMAVKKIEVAGGAMVSPEMAIALSGIEPGGNLFAFDAAEAAFNIKKNPWVESVKVTRRVPDTVRVKITERVPVAVVKMDGLYLMDAGGVIFKAYTLEEGLDLPVVTGLSDEILEAPDGKLEDGLLDLIVVLKERAGFGIVDVSEINVDPDYGLSLYTIEEGVKVELGYEGFEKKLRAFEKVVAARGSLAGVESMDLNTEREVVVRFATNVIKEGGAI